MAALELPGRTPTPPKVAPTKIYQMGHPPAKPRQRYYSGAQTSDAGEHALLPIKCCAQDIAAASARGSDEPSAIFRPAKLLKTSVIERIMSAYARQIRWEKLLIELWQKKAYKTLRACVAGPLLRPGACDPANDGCYEHRRQNHQAVRPPALYHLARRTARRAWMFCSPTAVRRRSHKAEVKRPKRSKVE